MNDTNWEDLRIFCHVVRGGSLARAAEATGLSPPTIGRQMRALETRLGRALFVRSRTGYGLLPEGAALYERVRGMEAAARAIEDWREGATELPIVTVALGTWMSVYLGGRLNAIWSPEDRFRLCFKTAERAVDLERREAEIALARVRPATGNDAARPAGAIAFAAYCARGFDRTRNVTWVALARDVARTPAERWTAEQPEAWVTVWADSPGILYDLTVGGAGRAILPCFLGDSDPQLVRAGPVLPALEEPHWILAHADERHRPEVRTMIERLADYVAGHRDLFSGRLAAAS
jgi:DNA-binding transcriptional LysR family regulator